MTIGGLQKLTLIDYPGKLAATVFLTGCNFSCPWCYSPELVLPEKIKKQLHPVKSPLKRGAPLKAGQFNRARISEKEFLDFLKERKKLLEGLVLCGGEPTINKKLSVLIKKIKKLRYLVKLDTNGSNPKMVKKLINDKLVDYIAMDIKLPKERYPEIFGKRVKIKDVEESIKILKEGRVDYEFRSTIIPEVHNKDDIIKMARWVSGARAYYLQQFKPEKTIDPKFEKIKPYPQEYLLEIQKAISPFFDICELR